LYVVSGAALLAASLAACTPAAEEKPAAGADVATPRNPFFGTWEVTRGRIAPWLKEGEPEPEADPNFTRFTLQADKSSGPPLLTCDDPQYATNMTTAAGLFEGNLPNPAADAAALGFVSPDITVLSFSCKSGTADIAADFAMLDDGQIMLGLDNVIYTFARTGD
jgi:hypothetical protein